jgi:hypothetical protein
MYRNMLKGRMSPVRMLFLYKHYVPLCFRMYAVLQFFVTPHWSNPVLRLHWNKILKCTNMVLFSLVSEFVCYFMRYGGNKYIFLSHYSPSQCPNLLIGGCEFKQPIDGSIPSSFPHKKFKAAIKSNSKTQWWIAIS